MNKILLILGVFLSVTFGASSTYASVDLRAEYPGYIWYIPTYQVDMKLGRNAILDVQERIVADFSDTSRRGIIREIPYKFRDFLNGQSRVTPVSFDSVTDFEGNEWEYKVSNNGDFRNLRIGNVNEFFSEPLDYVISYSVENLINSFGPDGEELGELRSGNESTRDELYWNAIGTEWSESPIGYYEVNVDLSEFTDEEVLDMECFIGGFGSEQTCEFVRNGDVYTVSGPMLGYQTGITVGAGFESGAITPEWSWRVMLYDLLELIVLAPFLILFSCYLWWRKHGKELPKKTIIPTYKLDPNLRAMEVGAFVDERFNNEDITAGLVDLAVRGYIEIKEIPKKGLFGKKSFKFTKKKEFDGGELESFEKKLLEGMFGRGKSVSSKDLEGVFYITVNKVKKDIFEYLVDQKYYVKNPNLVFGKYMGLGSFVLFGSAWLSGITGTWYLLPFLIPLGLGLMIISPFMSKKTRYGRDVHAHILGFKDFIKVAEKDRLKFFQEYQDELSKDDQIKTFEKLLPFAIAYGMGDRWADLFGDLLSGYSYNPVWYSGTDGFRMNNLSNGLNDMGRTMRAAAVPPSSSGTSGGSFSSGGFSGGGFGGGGGSSW